MAAGRSLLEEVLDQHRNVLRSIAQRRQLDAHHGQADGRGRRGIARLRTSAARSRLVAAMTRTSTRRYVDAADRLDLPSLQRAEKLRLQLERQLADLVEEDGAAVGLLEGARRGRDRRR